MTTRSISVLIIIIMAVFGCKENSDDVDPITIIEEPNAGDTVFVDQGLRIIASLEDNDLLSQYRIKLIGIDSLNGLAVDTLSDRIEVYDSEPGQFYLDQTISFEPEQFNGHFSLMLHALDQAGNRSEGDTVNFYLKNPLDLETITFKDTVAFDTIEEFRGGVGVNVDVLDDKITYVKMTVSSNVGSTVIAELEWLDVGYHWVDINEWFAWDAAWPQGNYTTSIVAWDEYGYREYTNTFYIKK